MNTQNMLFKEVDDLNKLFDTCKDRYFDCFLSGGFTTVGDENGVHITFLNFHCRHEMLVSDGKHKTDWVRCENPGKFQQSFDECIKLLMKEYEK